MKIAIIGAGIQGSCLALSLAKQGVKSVLIDKTTPMQAASHRNEGKIHLGFVYALDLKTNIVSFVFGVRCFIYNSISKKKRSGR